MTTQRRTPFSVEVDLDVDAAYVRMTNRSIVRTEQLGDGVNVDLDEVGVVVGIELLWLDAEIPFTRLMTDFHVHSADVELLRALRPSIAESMLRSASEGTSSAQKRETVPA